MAFIVCPTSWTEDEDFDAVIDGYFLTEPPAVTFSKGKAAHVPLLVGLQPQAFVELPQELADENARHALSTDQAQSEQKVNLI